MGTLILILGLALIGCSGAPQPDMGQENEKKAHGRSSADVSCGDFLRRFYAGRVPAQLEFIRCSEGDGGQLVRSAEYRVSGSDAEIVEEFLHRTYSMSKLHFICCLWEPGPEPDGSPQGLGSFQVDDYYFSVSMGVAEPLVAGKLVTERERWSEIPYFYVTIELWDV